MATMALLLLIEESGLAGRALGNFRHEEEIFVGLALTTKTYSRRS